MSFLNFEYKSNSFEVIIMLYFKIFKVINQDGIEENLQNLKVNERVSILDAKRNESLKILSSSGEIMNFDKVLNVLFDGVLLIKTDKRTWILEPV